MRDFPPCQLCHAAPASCKSHIIPRQFFMRIRGAEKHLVVFEVEEKLERSVSQSGVWEQGILCPKCDTQLGHFDAYAYKVLPEHISKDRIRYLAPGVTIVEMGAIDIDRFKRFLVALLWRASRSSHDLFQYVKLRPYERKMKAVLTGKDAKFLNDVDCVIVLLDPPRYDKILIPPFINTGGTVDCIQFYLYPWRLHIKLDGRPFDKTFRQLTLRGGAQTRGLVINQFSAGEVRLIADLQKKLKAHHAELEGRKQKK